MSADWLRAQLHGPADPRPFEEVAEISFVPVQDGSLRVLRTRPAAPTGRPVVLIPGFGATVASWQDFYALTQARVELIVIETLEKRTTTLTTEHPDFSVGAMARDIGLALDHLGVSGRDHVLMGSCWGATLVLEGLMRGAFDPPTVAVYDPMHAMWFPKLLLRYLAPHIPPELVDLLRAPISAVALHGMDQPRQRARAESAIAAADTLRWSRAAAAAADVELYGRLGAIAREVLVFNGSHDKVHDRSHYPRIARELPRGRFFFLEVDEVEREHLAGVIALELAKTRADAPVPDTLAAFEVDLERPGSA
ncbi:MAG: hypothetical protein H6739_03870 [Alphaproteobacteria bacterium]|nr:hypothetical protein [Alphaproteobacteria bacterium]